MVTNERVVQFSSKENKRNIHEIHDLKRHSIYRKIRCKKYYITHNLKKFITNLVSFLCNVKNYYTEDIKVIIVKVNEIDNSIHIKVIFKDFISHIPVTKPIKINKIKGKNHVDFQKIPQNKIFGLDN